MKGWSVKWLKESIAYTEVRIRKAFSCRRTPATILQRKKAGTLLARSRRSACPAIDQLLGELPTAGQCAVFIHGWDLKRIRKQHSSDCLQYELVNPPGGVVSLARTGFKGVFVDADVLHAVIDGNSAVPLATGLPVPGHRHRFSAVHTIGAVLQKYRIPVLGSEGAWLLQAARLELLLGA